ncbi:MAG TPA: diaminopimelate decarboxylase [Bryobacteraceae bacterium]|nr:diaminopimelate decarboxylase [Bryobacteraceae bacterium]
MNPFSYRGDALYCDDVPVSDIAARAGTPCYIYSANAILATFRAYDDALAGIPHRVCYAVKANSSLGVLALLARAGAGFDIVSGGELHRALLAGADPGGIVFSGVGKTADEIEYALASGIHSFNCESEAELALLDVLAARRGVKACAAVRVNPDVDAETHPYISTGMREHKFGIDINEVEGVYERALALRNVTMGGVSCHIGSQLLNTAPLIEALDRLLALAERLRARGCAIGFLDLGGGLGVPYRPEDASPDIAGFTCAIRDRIQNRGLTLMLEPGRSIVAQAGILVTRVLYRKGTASKEFIVVDAAMNDLIRPSLYQSHHEIIPVRRSGRGTLIADVVGPVCESADFLARDREMANVLPGDLLAVCTAGAYGFVASSNYNSRVRPPETLVEGSAWRIIRTRETYDDLVRGETA